MPKFRKYKLITGYGGHALTPCDPIVIYVPDESDAGIDEVVAYANANFYAPKDEPYFFPEGGDIQTLELTMEETAKILPTKHHYKP